MKKIKIIFIICITLSIMSISNIAYADIKQYNGDLETKNSSELNRTMEFIINSILSKDTTYIQDNQSMFTVDCFNRLNNYINNLDTIQSDGILEKRIDRIYPNNSSTKDCVIMANIKLSYNQSEYNNLYLYEFHVNAEGQIYGYNIWVY